MRKFIPHFAFLICGCQTFAQPAQIDHSFEQGGWGQFLTQYNYERPAPEVKGDYYLFDDWVVADINLYADEIFKDKQLNLNIVTGAIEVPYGERIRILDKAKIESFKVGTRKFINSGYLSGTKYGNTFFEVIEEGDVNVYCQYYSILRPPSYGVPGAPNRNYTVIIRKNYFVQLGSSFVEFNKSKRSSLKYFQTSRSTINYINTEKLKINHIKGFVKAARFYNTNQ